MKKNRLIFAVLSCTLIVLLASCTKQNTDIKKVEGVEGKIFCIDEYRSFAFTDCGIVSTLELTGDGEETLGIWEDKEGTIECRFADGSWETFTYNADKKEIVSQGGDLVAAGQVFDFTKKIIAAAPFIGNEFGASVAPAYFTWQFYDCGLAKVTMASDGYGETDIGVFYYDPDTGEFYLAGGEFTYNAEKQRIDTYDTSISDLKKEMSPVMGKTFNFSGSAEAKAVFTDCSILAISSASGVSFYEYSYRDGKITCYPLFETVDEQDAQILVYDNNEGTLKLFIEPPSIPYTRELRLKSGTRMNGDDVRQLQEVLIYLGYLAKGEADGYFGPKTEAALKDWQGDNGFTKDGIMSQAVYNAIFDLQ